MIRKYMSKSFYKMYFIFCRSGYIEEQLNPVDLNLINDLWVPNVFIYNLKTFKVHIKEFQRIIKISDTKWEISYFVDRGKTQNTFI